MFPLLTFSWAGGRISPLLNLLVDQDCGKGGGPLLQGEVMIEFLFRSGKSPSEKTKRDVVCKTPTQTTLSSTRSKIPQSLKSDYSECLIGFGQFNGAKLETI